VQEASLNILHSGTAIVDGNLCIIVAVARCVLTVPNSLLPRDDNPECPPISMFGFDNFIDNSRDDVSFMFILNGQLALWRVCDVSRHYVSGERIGDHILDTDRIDEGEGNLIISESMLGSFFQTADVDLRQLGQRDPSVIRKEGVGIMCRVQFFFPLPPLCAYIFFSRSPRCWSCRRCGSRGLADSVIHIRRVTSLMVDRISSNAQDL
jgi:hypothetical protein